MDLVEIAAKAGTSLGWARARGKARRAAGRRAAANMAGERERERVGEGRNRSSGKREIEKIAKDGVGGDRGQ